MPDSYATNIGRTRANVTRTLVDAIADAEHALDGIEAGSAARTDLSNSINSMYDAINMLADGASEAGEYFVQFQNGSYRTSRVVYATSKTAAVLKAQRVLADKSWKPVVAKLLEDEEHDESASDRRWPDRTEEEEAEDEYVRQKIMFNAE